MLLREFPWGRLREAQKLRLAERYGPDRINAACAQALAFELLDAGRVVPLPAALLGRPRVSPTSPSPRRILTMLDLTLIRAAD